MNPFYNSIEDKIITCGNLPHWTQQGKLHFVTFRLADSLPEERVQQVQQERQKWIALHSLPYTEQEQHEYYRLFSEPMENWLDAGHGECLLSKPEYAEIVAGALNHFEQQRYILDHWVIMPNHVHVLLIPMGSHTLENILHSWKSFTANTINSQRGTNGKFWQHESFDHVVRSEKQLSHFRQYIIDNWTQAGEKALISIRKLDLK